MDYLSLIDRSRTRAKRSDVTPIFAHHAAFVAMIEDLAAPFHESEVALVAGLDSLGFIVGTALALRLGAGLIVLRKGGKLPVEATSESFTDYSGQSKTLELRTNPFPRGTRVLVADEWVDTGAQARAALTLLEGAGAVIVGLAAIGFRRHPGTADLEQRYRCHGLYPPATG